jgi:hypothetical protein
LVDGWFVFAVVASIVILAGLVLAAAIMRASWAQREREALSSSDLRAVEESAVMLIEQLKAEADRAIGDLSERCALLRELIVEADGRIDSLRSSATGQQVMVLSETRDPSDLLRKAEAIHPSLDTAQVLRLANSGLDCVDIAKAIGADCADVKVAMKLGRLTSDN